MEMGDSLFDTLDVYLLDQIYREVYQLHLKEVMSQLTRDHSGLGRFIDCYSNCSGTDAIPASAIFREVLQNDNDGFRRWSWKMRILGLIRTRDQERVDVPLDHNRS